MAEEPPKPQSWWQTLPGILTAVATIITAATGLVVALNQAGLFSRKPPAPGQTQTLVMAPADELERKLKDANIMSSTGTDADRKRVYGYLTDTEPAYRLLAAACIQIMGNQRLKQTGYLDMIDKHYTLLVGESNFASANGGLHLEKVKEAMVKAHNDYRTADATSFEEIVEPR